MTLTIVADDLTGACDSGTLFAGKAPVAVTVWPRRAPAAPVRVIDTESRRLPAAAATARIRTAVTETYRPASGGTPRLRDTQPRLRDTPARLRDTQARLRDTQARLRDTQARLRRDAGRWFKKIDSTLRGPIGAEVEALAEAVGAPGALVCPAFPAQGRVVRNRILCVHGHAGSSVVELLRPQLRAPVAWIPLDEVRAGTTALAGRLGRLAGTVAVADAETDDDLAALVDATLEHEPPPLLAGAAGLAGALARRLGLLAERPALPRARRWLLVVGSRDPVSRRQADEALRAGLRVLKTADTDGPERIDAAAALAREACALLEARAFDAVAVTGGETARLLFEALEAERIDLVGAPSDGLALGLVRAPRFPDLPIVTKAGGFGAAELYVRLLAEAAG